MTWGNSEPKKSHGSLKRRHALNMPWLALLMLPGLTACTGEGLPILGPLPFNFHVVDEGRAYRSAQPTGDQLTAVISQFGIKTVVNLRGANPGESWYDTEAAVCEAMQVTLANHRLSSQDLPPPEVLAAVIDTFKTAEYPILIHCQGGAERTGMMSAVYRMAILGQDRTAAMAELTPEYFYFRELKPCMATLVEMFEPTDQWLQQYAANYDSLTCTP